MTETQELKPLPCPLCGRDAEEFVDTEDHTEPLVGGHALLAYSERTFFGVRCNHCDLAQTNPFSTREDAITAWNTRPREAELEAALEEAKGALEEIATQHKGPASYQIIARYALTRIRAAKGGE